MSYRAIPLLVIALFVYNVLVFAFAGGAPDAFFYGSSTFDAATGKIVAHSADIFHIRMPNSSPDGGEWHFTRGDFVVLLGLILLAFEILKSSYVRGGAMADQALSTVLLILFLVEFLLVSQAATPLFLLLTLMSAFDVIVGAIIGIRTARRDIGLGGAVTGN